MQLRPEIRQEIADVLFGFLEQVEVRAPEVQANPNDVALIVMCRAALGLEVLTRVGFLRALKRSLKRFPPEAELDENGVQFRYAVTRLVNRLEKLDRPDDAYTDALFPKR